MPDEHVGIVEFARGVWLPVMQDPDGRQYVFDADGEKVYGVWTRAEDEPRPDAVVQLG
jgi:hypothetical protein